MAGLCGGTGQMSGHLLDGGFKCLRFGVPGFISKAGTGFARFWVVHRQTSRSLRLPAGEYWVVRRGVDAAKSVRIAPGRTTKILFPSFDSGR